MPSPAIGIHLHTITGSTQTANDDGYWFVGSDGNVYGFANASSFGNAPSCRRDHRPPSRVGFARLQPHRSAFWGGLAVAGPSSAMSHLPVLPLQILGPVA